MLLFLGLRGFDVYHRAQLFDIRSAAANDALTSPWCSLESEVGGNRKRGQLKDKL